MNYDKLFQTNCVYQLQVQDIEALQQYLLKKQGWVYIAQTEDNHLLKIGRTGKNPWERAKSLSSTGVLHDYEIFFALPVFNQFLAEAVVHNKLKKFRRSKELFNVNKETAISAIEQAYSEEEKLLSRFLNVDMLREDIELVAHAIKK